MDHSTANKNKINSINKGLWTINAYEFKVEIEIFNKDEKEKYYREIKQAELEAIKTQIIISKLLDEDDAKPYTIFIDHFKKMKRYQKVVKYLNSQGITKFERIYKKKFDSFESVFNEKWIFFKRQSDDEDDEEEENEKCIPIYKNNPNTEFLTDNIKYKTFRAIGETIHKNEDLDNKLYPYKKCILGFGIPKYSFESSFNKFMEKQAYDVLFDSFKLGCKFCHYFSNLKILYSAHKLILDDHQIYDQIWKLKDTINFDFTEKLGTCFRTNNLMFIKVIRPSHCYHCILSITRIMEHHNNRSLYLNEKMLIFCQRNCNFVQRINDISESSAKQSNLTYFIIHPEMLNEDDHSFFIEFINTRMNSLLDHNLPRIIIISSLNYRTFCYKNLHKFDDIEIKIPKELIGYLCKLSHPDCADDYCYHLYYSKNAGSGKTYQILQDFKDKKNCIYADDHTLKSLFVDINMQKLPKLEYVENGEIKKHDNLHLDLSPELFDNNYQFFDYLWKFAVLGYQVNSDGICENTTKNIFFEVPTLSKKQYPDGGFIDKADFPIYCHYYHKIESSQTDMQIPERVKQFCDTIFKDNIKYTFELLQKMFLMFYPGREIDESYFVPRILEKINLFMDEFCMELPLDDDNSKLIFLLLLKTNFHVWNMECIFNDKTQPKSFIIMANQNLFSSIHNRKKWILLCFSSFGEKNIWNTECLKDDFGLIDESKLFTNDYFRKLIDNPNIEIYSNQLNYDENQAYFFSIIRNFFYYNEDKDTLYRQVTDGVILNDIKNSDSFETYEKIFNSFLFEKTLSESKKIYEQSPMNGLHKWTKIFDLFYSILIDYNNKLFNELIYNLSNNEMVKRISKIMLTLPFVKRFIIMIIRIYFKQPLILEGFTGEGKTMSVGLIKELIKIAQINKDFNWNFHQIDCHGALELNELLMNIKYELCKNINPEINHLFFFDELNSSPVSSYIMNQMNNFHLRKENISNININGELMNSSIVFIASINPYKKINKFSREIARVGIKQLIPSKISKYKLCNTTPENKKDFYIVEDKNKLAYNVRELSQSTEMIVLKFDTELFFINEDELKLGNSSFLPPEEIKTIQYIINYYLNILINNSNYKIKNNENLQTNLDTIQETLKSNKEKILKIIHSLICKSFLEIRELMCLKSILSYRDAQRSMMFFILFFKKLIGVYFMKEHAPDITKTILEEKIIPQSIVLSIMLSIVYRFSNETKIETYDGNICFSNEEEEQILRRCNKFGLKLHFSKDRKYFKVSIRSTLLGILNKIEWEAPLVKPSDWNKTVISYSNLKCMKYLYNDENDRIRNSSLFKIDSLMINLFAISSCFSCLKENKEYLIPCIIIGMPGTSKTLSYQLFADYKTNHGKNKLNFFNTTYQSTRLSEEDGLNAHYRDCAMFMVNNKEGIAVCFIDELGLANLNDKRPLKLLQYYFDNGIMLKSNKDNINIPVISIAASNYQPDFANANRGTLICDDLPTDKEIAESFYFSELEANQKIIINDDFIRNYKNNYFDDDNNMFKWKENHINEIQKYEKFLNNLWQLSDEKERPDMLFLRPFYLLFNSIFHNRLSIYDDNELISTLCFYFVSVIPCNLQDSLEKVRMLLDSIVYQNDGSIDNDIKSILDRIDNYRQNCFITFKAIFNLKNPNNQLYDNFCEIIASQKRNSDHSVDYDRIYGKIYEQNKDDSFNFFKDIINNQNESDVYYKSLKEISKSNEIFNALTSKINDPKYDNYKLLRSFVVNNNKTETKRPLCITTKNYQCLDFIEELIKTITHYYCNEENQEIDFMHIYPCDFQVPKINTIDNKIGKLVEIINSSKEGKSNKRHYVTVVGDVYIVDSLLDILNSPSEGKAGFKPKKPMINKNGYSIELEEFPKNIVFCFIINENDFQNRDSADSFPVPLLDRLNQICLDYDQRDEFGIIKKYQKYHLKNVGYSIPYTTIIHEYFNNFVDNLKNIPIPKEENHFAVVFTTTNIDKSFFSEISHEIFGLNNNYEDIKWQEKIIIVQFYPNVGKKNIYQQNIENFEKDEIHKFTYYCSKEFDKFYEIQKNHNIIIPFPKPNNYDSLENDGSINKLLTKLNDDVIHIETVRAIIFTTSPIMGEINFVSEFRNKGIKPENTTILFEQFIMSSKDFNRRIENDNKENIIVHSNHFQIENDRYLRYLLEKQKGKKYIIIIYHVKFDAIPDGIYTSLNWPVFWIESITKSPLSSFPTAKMVKYIRFKGFFKEEMHYLYMKVLMQLYNDISLRYEKCIDAEKMDVILNIIFSKLESKKNKNGKSILDVNFNDLIDKLEGKKTEKSYKNIDFKREFYYTIISQIPILYHLIQVVILNCCTINERKIEDTEEFLSRLCNYENLEGLFKIADLDNIIYQQANSDLYFPELIFPQVISIYKVYIKNRNDYPKIDKEIFQIYHDLQINPEENYLHIFFYNYFIGCLDSFGLYNESQFKGFEEKLKELLK